MNESERKSIRDQYAKLAVKELKEINVRIVPARKQDKTKQNRNYTALFQPKKRAQVRTY